MKSKTFEEQQAVVPVWLWLSGILIGVFKHEYFNEGSFISSLLRKNILKDRW